jgi:hypothetical protein
LTLKPVSSLVQTPQIIMAELISLLLAITSGVD